MLERMQDEFAYKANGLWKSSHACLTHKGVQLDANWPGVTQTEAKMRQRKLKKKKALNHKCTETRGRKGEGLEENNRKNQNS